MNKYITIRIAGTRFAVRCNHVPFMEWLVRDCSDFISGDEPYLRINVHLDMEDTNGTPGLISGVAIDNNVKPAELQLHMRNSNPVDCFLAVLQVCLRCTLLLKQPPDLLLHAAGIVHEDKAYIFSGFSGAGKSTVCKILAGQPRFEILHDDMVAISRTDDGFYAWSTPLSGEMPAVKCKGAPLKAIFLLKQNTENFIRKLSNKSVVALLGSNMVPPLVVKNENLAIKSEESLESLLMMVEYVPCYELHFKPDFSFWDSITTLIEDELATTV